MINAIDPLSKKMKMSFLKKQQKKKNNTDNIKDDVTQL